MDSVTKLRYQGFISTPPLWQGTKVSPFKQIDLPKDVEIVNDATSFKHHRLGKLVEEFVFYQLKNQDSVSWICDSLQIQEGKRTVGEIDALYYSEGRPVHLEIAYKFYLLDTIDTYGEPLAYWIGPNRKDSLFYKLRKLHKKQFPLLHNSFTESYLDKYNLNAQSIEQKMCFKAQLFLPFQNSVVDVSPLNNQSIAGFYISYSEMVLFTQYRFYIPDKIDWLVIPNHQVDWIDYDSSLAIINAHIINKRSPLIWLKDNKDVLSKCFVTYW